MKKTILLIIACFVTFNLFAQNKVYCEIVEKNPNNKKVKITIDFGQERKKSKGQQTLVNEDGDLIIFNSKIDALNYMSELGWDFIQAYTITRGSAVGGIGSTDSEIHWLLCKVLKEGESPYDGLITKEAYKLSK